MWVILETAQVPTKHTSNSHWSGNLAASFKDDFMSVLVSDKTAFAVISLCKKAEKKGTEVQGKYLLYRATLHTHSTGFPCWIHGPLRKLRTKSPCFATLRCQFAFLSLSAEHQHMEMLWNIATVVSFFPDRLGQTTECLHIKVNRQQQQSSERRCSKFQRGSAEVRPSSLTSLIRV